jgi:hypothetical protein
MIAQKSLSTLLLIWAIQELLSVSVPSAFIDRQALIRLLQRGLHRSACRAR